MALVDEKGVGEKDAGYHVESAYTSSEQQDTTRRASQVLLNQENLSYGSSGIKGIIESPYVCAAAFLASMGGFSFGYGTFMNFASLILVQLIMLCRPRCYLPDSHHASLP